MGRIGFHHDEIDDDLALRREQRRIGGAFRRNRRHVSGKQSVEKFARVLTGNDPVPLGSNNSGRGVGGSMVHYAGYTPRLHPSDFATATNDGTPPPSS